MNIRHSFFSSSNDTMDELSLYLMSRSESVLSSMRNLLKAFHKRDDYTVLSEGDLNRIALLDKIVRFQDREEKLDCGTEVKNIIDLCLSILSATDSESISHSGVHNAVRLLSTCLNVTVTPVESIDRVLCICYEALEACSQNDFNDHSYNELRFKTVGLDAFCAVQVMQLLMTEKDLTPNCTTALKLRCEQLLSAVVKSVPIFPIQQLKKLLHKVIPQLIDLCGINRQHNLNVIVEAVFGLSSDKSTGYVNHLTDDRSYLILCALADVFFSEDGSCVVDLRVDPRFWSLIQHGLWHNDTLSRRRCVYLLKRVVDLCSRGDITEIQRSGGDACLFSWDREGGEDLCAMWQDFILLVETLEEKQFHLIEALFPKMDNLITHTYSTNTAAPSSLHSSWLIAIFRRTFVHQNLRVVSWGVRTFLQIDLDRCPLIRQGQVKFMCTEVIQAVKSPHLYSTYTNDNPPGTPPDIARILLQYLKNCLHILTDRAAKAEYFNQVLDSVLSVQWSSVALFYLTLALTKLDPTPLWGPQSLLKIREIHADRLVPLELYVRDSLEMCLFRVLFLHLDLDRVDVNELCVTLSVFGRDKTLERGSILWMEFVDWLRSAVSRNPAWSGTSIFDWVASSVRKYISSHKDADSLEKSSSSVARVFVLGCDAGVVSATTVSAVLSPAISLLLGPDQLPINANRAVELLATIVAELGPVSSADEIGKTIIQPIRGCLSKIYAFMRSTIALTNEHPTREIIDTAVANKFIQSLPLLMSMDGRSEVKGERSEIMVLVSSCVETLSHQEDNCVVKKCAALSLLSVVCDDITSSSLSPQHAASICDFIQTIPLTTSTYPPILVDWGEAAGPRRGRVISDYLHHHWVCLRYLVYNLRDMTPNIRHDVAQFGLDSMDTGAGPTITVIMQSLSPLVPAMLAGGEEDLVVRIWTQSWSRVCEGVRQVYFWQELRAYVELVCQPTTVVQPPQSPVLSHLLQMCERLHDMSEERAEIYNILITRLCHILRGSEARPCLHTFGHVLFQATIFGISLKKSVKHWLELCTYIASLGRGYSPINLSDTSLKPDTHVRVVAVDFLASLSPQDPEHRRLVHNVMGEMMALHRTILTDTSVLYFSNSPDHLHRNRIVQALLILEPFIDATNIDEVWEYVWECIPWEYQPSVRYLLEWLCLRLIHRFPASLSSLFTLLSTFSENKNTAFCSVLSVMSHIGPRIPSSRQVDFYDEALRIILPYCMVHHFNTRVHAHATILKLWRQCESLELSSLLARHSLVSCCLNVDGKNHSSKTIEKLLSHFFFFRFDFILDYSLEVIFETLPRLSCVAESEFMRSQDFLQLDSDWSCEDHAHLPLVNRRDSLRHCQPGAWRLKGQDVFERGVGDEESNGDFQKKIVPWRFMNPEDTGVVDENRRGDGLVLVTSLIDKIPNLGGLCRTSEIFGVSEFVIGCLKHTEDRVFQSLSVTAHKWLPITEVTKPHLKDYLVHKQAAGYTLVGVEQTANSVCLTNYKFPVKSLLLLGNEKQGIPVDLIQILDVCVEIPQQGVVRSLNVHVSGALLVWEYARQRLLSGL